MESLSQPEPGQVTTRQTAVVPLGDETQAAVARRKAAELCRRMGLSKDATARAELITAELAGNVLRHGTTAGGKAGMMLLGPAGAAGAAGHMATPALQMIAADAGQGIANIERALQDGFSTGSTPGTGLGAVKRHAQAVDIYSRRETGTVISAVVADDAYKHDRLAVVTVSLEDDPMNGDGWAVFTAGGRTLYIVADGLGHGLYASEASAMAIAITAKLFAENAHVSLTTLLERMHVPMHATRGAAVSLCAVEAGMATCAGVGNVNMVLHAPGGVAKTMIAHNGTVGHQMRRVQEFTAPAEDALLVMHSDGLTTRWKLGAYPGLERHAPATIAGVLYRDAMRGRDDATVLVARLGAGAAA